MAGTSAVAPGAGALAGALDPSFGSGGRVVTPIAIGEVRGGGMAIQPDGRIVVAGTIPGAGGTDFVVARYLPDGGLDPSFGSGGGVVTPVGPGVDEANAIALQPDGRIVVAGRAVISANESDFAVVRYLPDGLLDPAFGSGGKVVTDVSPSADEGTAGDGGRAVVVQPDGRIVVGGTSFEDFGLVRYLANGSLDTTFGTGGRVVTDLSPADRLSALALRPDGRIVAGGSALGTGSQADFVLVGYTASGALDPGFGGAGAVATDFSGDEDSVTALALQPDGRVVAAGYALLAGVGDAIAVARYSAAGQPDPTFAGDGTVTFQVAGPGLARAVAVQANGRIVVAGNNAADGGDFHVARLRADGQLDPDFDGDGRALVDFGSERDQAAAVAVQADGRILVFGTNHTFGLTVGSFALARFEGTAAGPLAGGYRMTAADGGVFTFGNRAFHGSTGDLRLNSPIVGGATDPATADGYWLAAADGGVFSFKAPFLGSAAGQVLDAPVVAIEATPTGLGYWLVTARGRIIAFGDAVFIGDTRALALNQPITRMAATPTGLGYWLLGRDGGVFTFGDATFFGSTGARRLNAPVIDLAPVPDGSGYWLVGSDGGVFTFGAAQFHGSTGDLRLNAPVVAALAAPSGAGYWLAASDGGVFTFGPGMAFHGSLGDRRLNSPVNDFIL